MHQAQNYISSAIKPAAGASPVTSVFLSAASASGLGAALGRDCFDYYYSGAVSLGEAVQGLNRGMYTWSTVKLYYAVFYFLRSALACKKIAIFYEGTKPYSWKADPGKSPKKLSGQTHKAVLSAFSSEFPSSSILSQEIGGCSPLEWLMKLRESANYTNARFDEPSTPAHFKMIDRIGCRKAIAAYMADSTSLYSFDEDHAALAYPIEVFKYVLRESAPLIFSDNYEADRKYLGSLFTDSNGPMSDIVRQLCT